MSMTLYGMSDAVCAYASNSVDDQVEKKKKNTYRFDISH